MPITLAEIVTTAMDCQLAGADGLHLHLRDEAGHHVLDAALYQEALGELALKVPGMAFQVTTEAVGRYSAAQQRQLVERLEPALVSISVKEMLAGSDLGVAVRFYRGCRERGVAVQHIVYGDDDLVRLNLLASQSAFAAEPVQLLFVLGRYSQGQQSRVTDLAPFLEWQATATLPVDWAACAFGQQESACLLAAHQAGGKVRAGFENSLWHHDGSIAEDNAARIREVVRLIGAAGPVE